MKLYTEEQVKKAMMMSSELDGDTRGCSYAFTNDEVLAQLTPIELPTDEEIWNEADKEENNSKHYAFTRGAKWMRNKTYGGIND
jgi:hypothetical protein